MNAILVVGATGTGKTTLIKKFIKKVSCKKALFIFDINLEYKEFYNKELINFIDFSEIAKNLKNSVIIIEEATIFLNNKGSNNNIIDLLVKKRHRNNTIFLVFHSIRAIPRYIYELSNYIYIFKTNDSSVITSKELKDDRIKDIIEIVKNNHNKFYFKVLKIY